MRGDENKLRFITRRKQAKRIATESVNSEAENEKFNPRKAQHVESFSEEQYNAIQLIQENQKLKQENEFYKMKFRVLSEDFVKEQALNRERFEAFERILSQLIVSHEKLVKDVTSIQNLLKIHGLIKSDPTSETNPTTTTTTPTQPLLPPLPPTTTTTSTTTTLPSFSSQSSLSSPNVSFSHPSVPSSSFPSVSTPINNTSPNANVNANATRDSTNSPSQGGIFALLPLIDDNFNVSKDPLSLQTGPRQALNLSSEGAILSSEEELNFNAFS